MHRVSFQHLLASRQIPIHYDLAEFEADIKTLKEMGYLYQSVPCDRDPESKTR